MRSTNQNIFLILSIISLLLCIPYIIGQLSESCKPKQQGNVDSPHHARLVRPTRRPINANLSSFGSVCHTPRCLALYSSVYQHSRRIPNIRHILWKSDKVSGYFAKQLRTWNDIHPDWNYVLWRDADLEQFVARYYTGALSKFKSLPQNIMRIDMIRYLILHRFGGVYADLDYVLVRPLDRFMRFPAIITIETEAHSFFHYGMRNFPPPLLGNPAFMMSEPRHPFFEFSILQLTAKVADHYFTFAGPVGLTALLTQYAADFRLADNPDGAVIVPPSRNFYPFENNSFLSSTSSYKGAITGRMQSQCLEMAKQPSVSRNITEYCKDVNNLDPITDHNELVYAIHDSNKPHSSYNHEGSPIFHDNPVDIRTVLTNVVMADAII